VVLRSVKGGIVVSEGWYCGRLRLVLWSVKGGIVVGECRTQRTRYLPHDPCDSVD